VSAQRAAEIAVVLEGVPLPAKKQELLAYARQQDESVAGDLQRLPEREYSSLNEVREALAPVQPEWRKSDPRKPRDESGQPPGGDSYTDPSPEPGSVRPSAPASNPPKKALEQQTKTQKRQQEKQKQLG